MISKKKGATKGKWFVGLPPKLSANFGVQSAESNECCIIMCMYPLQFAALMLGDIQIVGFSNALFDS